jgi:hypothetical protein
VSFVVQFTLHLGAMGSSYVCLKKITPFLRYLALLTGLVGSTTNGFSQPFQLRIQPVFADEIIVLEKPLHIGNGDSMTISTLKYYLGDFEFWKNGQLVIVDKTYHLLDLEEPNSLHLIFDLPEKAGFDSLCFNLGTDSLTNTAGVMGGDLDPTKGMFWTWQSGYINLKLEGISSRCPTRGGLFEFHLGGYFPPFQTVRRVKINVGRVWNPSDVNINFNLAPFFHSVNWQKKPNIMSPCIEATQLMEVLSTSFSWHEK